MTRTLTGEQVTALRRQLARVSGGQSASTRLLAVLANESVVGDFDVDVVALRDYLLRTKHLADGLHELVASSVSWESLVAAARKHRASMADDAKRRSVVVEKAAALLAGILGASAGGLGTGAGKRTSDPTARLIWAVVGGRILTDLWTARRDATVISETRLSAELGMDRRRVAEAIAAGVESGVLAVVSRHRSGAKRCRIRPLAHGDFVDVLMRHGDAVNSIVEAITGERPSFLSLVSTGDLNIEGERWQRRMERKAAQAEAMAEHLAPRGAMRALDADQAGRVAAELVLTGDSLVWRGKGASAALWLGMLKNALGFEASKHCTGTRVRELLGVDVFERLNAGTSLNDVLRGQLSWDGAVAAEARTAAWTARSVEVRANTTQWSSRKDVAEPQLTAWFEAVDGAPRWDSSTPEDRAAFVERMRVLVSPMEMGTLTSAFYGKRFERRLAVNRGWERVAAGLAARAVFAGMPKLKSSRTGVVASAPVEVGGVLV